MTILSDLNLSTFPNGILFASVTLSCSKERLSYTGHKQPNTSEGLDFSQSLYLSYI